MYLIKGETKLKKFVAHNVFWPWEDSSPTLNVIVITQDSQGEVPHISRKSAEKSCCDFSWEISCDMHFVENQNSHFPLSVRGGGNWLKMKNVPSKVSRFVFQACLQNLGNFKWKENVSIFLCLKIFFLSKTINIFQLFLYINSKLKAIVQWQNYISALARGFCMWQGVNKQLWWRNELELLNKTTLTNTHVYSFFSLFPMNANKSCLRFFCKFLKLRDTRSWNKHKLKCMEEYEYILLHYTVL